MQKTRRPGMTVTSDFQREVLSMTTRRIVAPFIAFLVSVSGVYVAAIGLTASSTAHEGHADFSTGEPGNPKKTARTIKVTMKEMMFDPSLIEVRKGDQIRFVLENDGTEDHEFMLATPAENREHGELMKKYPGMKHDDPNPNGKRVAPHKRAEILWKFTKAGEFEYACLIPTHYDFGMYGKVIVK
jgi:uncharacterized cupredoxin-like copper-binding protein